MIALKEIYTPSNLISFFRLLLAIPLWYVLADLENESSRYLALFLCLFAAFTDILDGWLARKRNEVSEAGKIIDPLADKIAMGLVIIRLFMLGEIPPYYFFMIIGRDLLIFLGGIYVTKKIGKVLPSNILGKATVIVIGIVILLVILQVNKDGLLFGAFYYSSIILIVFSFAAYVFRAVEFLKKKDYGAV